MDGPLDINTYPSASEHRISKAVVISCILTCLYIPFTFFLACVAIVDWVLVDALANFEWTGHASNMLVGIIFIGLITVMIIATLVMFAFYIGLSCAALCGHMAVVMAMFSACIPNGDRRVASIYSVTDKTQP